MPPTADLPWILDPDRKGQPGARPRLDRRNLFLLICRLAYQDGSVSEVEKQLMGQFARALKMDPAEAKEFSRLARQEFKQGLNTGKGEADLHKVFFEASKFAGQDGEIDEGERALLESFGRGIGITGSDLEAILAQAVAAVPIVAPLPAAAPGESPVAPVAPVAPVKARGVRVNPGGEYRVEVDLDFPDFDTRFGGI